MRGKFNWLDLLYLGLFLLVGYGFQWLLTPLSVDPVGVRHDKAIYFALMFWILASGLTTYMPMGAGSMKSLGHAALRIPYGLVVFVASFFTLAIGLALIIPVTPIDADHAAMLLLWEKLAWAALAFTILDRVLYRRFRVVRLGSVVLNDNKAYWPGTRITNSLLGLSDFYPALSNSLQFTMRNVELRCVDGVYVIDVATSANVMFSDPISDVSGDVGDYKAVTQAAEQHILSFLVAYASTKTYGQLMQSTYPRTEQFDAAGIPMSWSGSMRLRQ